MDFELACPTLTTSSGRKIQVDQMRSTDVDPLDIAHALPHLCRFGGHGLFFTSVGMHVLLVSILAEEAGESREVVKACFSHDFSEAYIVDVPSPVKVLLPQYMELEEKIQDAIRQRFMLSNDPEVWAKVKKYDRIALNIEARLVFEPPPDWAPPTTDFPRSVDTYCHMVMNPPATIEEAILQTMEMLGMVSR